MDCLIPNLIIQPLVENAIIHGFTAGKEGYMLSIRGYERKGRVWRFTTTASAWRRST